MENLIDLERFPLHRLDEPQGEQLVTRCIEELGRDGMFTLKGFVRSEALDHILPPLLKKFEHEAFT
ncbi:MAG: 2OG-Fe(II) oxygenase, partial [Gammaproteobacteria bacterium]|nr:2OG-Fe(II) oxygenase [Gammaproteobacteria bacterium]